MTMICDICGRTGIRWVGPLSNLTHTECPHCGGINCQRAESYDPGEIGEQCASTCSDAFREAWKVAIIAFDEARFHGDDDPFDAALGALRAAPIGMRVALTKEVAPEIAAAHDAADAMINGFIEACQLAEIDLVKLGNHREAALMRARIGSAQFCTGAISDAVACHLMAREAEA